MSLVSGPLGFQRLQNAERIGRELERRTLKDRKGPVLAGICVASGSPKQTHPHLTHWVDIGQRWYRQSRWSNIALCVCFVLAGN